MWPAWGAAAAALGLRTEHAGRGAGTRDACTTNIDFGVGVGV